MTVRGACRLDKQAGDRFGGSRPADVAGVAATRARVERREGAAATVRPGPATMPGGTFLALVLPRLAARTHRVGRRSC